MSKCVMANPRDKYECDGHGNPHHELKMLAKFVTKRCKLSSNENSCVPKTTAILKPLPNSTGQWIHNLIVQKQKKKSRSGNYQHITHIVVVKTTTGIALTSRNISGITQSLKPNEMFSISGNILWA